MVRLALTAQQLIGRYPVTPLTAGSADFVWTLSGADFADGFSLPFTGKEIILFRNDNVGVVTVTLNSTVDDKNRTGDITAYSLGIGDYVALGPFPKDGWHQADGKMYGAASVANISIAVLKLPAGM